MRYYVPHGESLEQSLAAFLLMNKITQNAIEKYSHQDKTLKQCLHY